jgi:cytoskeletal protein CcmA (bactofilin family)
VSSVSAIESHPEAPGAGRQNHLTVSLRFCRERVRRIANCQLRIAAKPLKRLWALPLATLLALPLFFAELRTSSQVIVPEGDVVAEDLYSFGGTTIIEGVVQGDVIAVTGELTITGTVQGDVMGLVGGPVRISGTVGGSVRVAAPSFDITGSVGDDLVAAAVEGSVGGDVGRDALLVVGDADLAGPIGRDVRAQSITLSIDGPVGRDVQVRVDGLALGDGADVGGDVLYKARRDASVASGAVVNGSLIRRTVLAPVWAKAVTRLFAILSLLGFVIAGLAALWLFRGTSTRAVELAGERPGRSALVGLAVVVAPPLLALPLFVTLVGIPIALFVLVAWVLVLFLGPYPAVARLGAALLRGRTGVAAAFVLGAVAWRFAIWLLPLVGALVYLAALLVGSGSFALAAWQQRTRSAAP